MCYRRGRGLLPTRTAEAKSPSLQVAVCVFLPPPTATVFRLTCAPRAPSWLASLPKTKYGVGGCLLSLWQWSGDSSHCGCGVFSSFHFELLFLPSFLPNEEGPLALEADEGAPRLDRWLRQRRRLMKGHHAWSLQRVRACRHHLHQRRQAVGGTAQPRIG